MDIQEKLPPKLVWEKPFKVRVIPQFKPVVCRRCGGIKFGLKAMFQKGRAAKMKVICAVCERTTSLAIKRFY